MVNRAHFVCPICRRKIEYDRRDGWGYGVGEKLCCSWKCQRQWEQVPAMLRCDKIAKPKARNESARIFMDINNRQDLDAEGKLLLIRQQFGDEWFEKELTKCGRKLSGCRPEVILATIVPENFRTLEQQRLYYKHRNARKDKRWSAEIWLTPCPVD